MKLKNEEMYSKKKYPVVGFCLYCGTRKGKLTQEHIMPLGLGGKDVLEQASCKVCASITGSFEQDCLRKMFGNVRNVFDYPTRRPKERPKSVRVEILNINGEVERIYNADLNEYPITAIFPVIKRFPIHGQITNSVVYDESLYYVSNEEVVLDFKKKIGAERIRLFALHSLSFYRMIAKIAYCYAAAEFGHIGFRPLLRGLILGRSDRYQPFIETDENPPERCPDFHHSLHAQLEMIDREPHVVVWVRLFSLMASPEYKVIVGRVVSNPKPP